MSSDENIIATPADNSMACEAISAKLIEVSHVAESLDGILHDTQDGLNIFESSVAAASSVDRKATNNSDDWNCSLKSSTEDESFVTASEYTPSRSSSYHTASECRGNSPWWTESTERSSIDLDSSDPEQQTMKLAPAASSTNASFDDSETSFRSPISFHDHTDSDNTAIMKTDSDSPSPVLPPKMPSPLPDYSEHVHENKIYTIFESPTSSPSHDSEEADGDSTKNLPTPLEEFYRKIQEKMAAKEQQNPRLIEDMAESLNRVWSDIQKILHDRRLIISLNVAFFERLGECYGKMSSLEVACRDTMIPIEVDAVKEFLEKFKNLRIDVLSSIMNPLTVGNQLLEKLKEVVSVGSLDSRPDNILEESKRSVTQVESWLEDLSDKRNNLETAWLNRKIQLEQCLILAQLTKDLIELEKILNKQRDEVLSTFTLGDSSRSADFLLQDYGTWKIDAAALRDKSLKITRSTEEVVKQGSFTGDEACAKAYSVLGSCTEYLDEIDLRESLLRQSKNFFVKAESVLKKLDELEVELKRISLRPGSPNIIPVHLKMMQEVSTAINSVLELGYSIIDEVGRTKPDALGIKAVVDEIESRKLYLESAFSKTSEKHIKVSEELNIFLQQYNDIFSWIELQKREKIISGSMNFMGNNSSQAKECLNLHQQLLRELEVKNEELQFVKKRLLPYLEYLEDSQRNDVNEKIQMLLKNWNDLNSFVSDRIPIIEIYLRFHQEAEHLTNLFNNFEQTLKTTAKSNDFNYIDTVWNKIQLQFTLLKNVAKHFTMEKSKVAEPYLQVDRSAKCIEKTLDAFSSRQLQISDVWEHWNVSKEINVILEQIMAENVETLTLTAKIEKELYPIIATSEQLPSELIRFVGSKWQTVQNEIHEAERDLSQRIDKIDKLEAKDQVSNDKIVEVKNNLNSIKTKLFTIGADYSELVDTILGFLNSYQEVYESIREYFAAKDQPQPLADNVENLIRDYEIFKSNTMERFRSLLAQSESVIDKIKMQEPPDAKEHDTDKIISLLERLRTYFETNAASENSELKRQYFIQEFDKMLTDLNENINDLQLQFNDMQEKFGESAATCKVASLSFEYFERNVDLLNKRIETFINSYKNSTISYPDTKPYVDGELDKLQRRWNDFKNNSDNLKRSMTLSQQYFNLLESVETRYHKAYTFLVNSANIKKEELKSSDSAFKLIDELEKYVIENKEMQMNDLRKLSQLSKDIFGIDKTENLNADNIFIFQSFEKLKSDIVDLVKDLKAKEDPIAMINEIDKSILVIESSEEATKLEVIHEIVPVVENDPPKFLKYLESSEVMEGKTFVFECIVQGTPEPSIQWLKYNSPISNGPHYQILNENGKCRLEIISVTMSDAAVYSCIATNLVGTSQSTANLIVNQMPQEEVHLLPPTFVKMLQNAYADERSSFEFACLVAGNPLPTVQWFRNDFCVDNDPRYSITYNNGNAVLKIASVKIEDQGIFTVKASNQVGYNECSAILSVEAVEQHLKPLIKVPLSNVVTQAGQKFNLECEIAGHPRPEIIWMHNGRQLSDHDVKLQFDDEKVKLTIAEALPKDSGIYRLIARNVVGEASTECYVSVESYIPIVKPSVPETIAPSIQLPLKDTSVFEGKPIRLDCVIVGQPEPEVIWLQNNKPVKESKDIIELIFQGDRCTLYIHEAFLEDAGEYKVVAINTAGEATSECCVTVTPLNIAEPAIRPQTERLVLSEMPPKFEKLLVDILANEGESIELECCLANGTLPEIQWYLNNKEITYNDRIQSVAKDDGTLKLIIRNVLPDDKGVYTVKATNSTGVAKCFSHLIVKSTANSSDTQVFQPEPEDKQVCPTFKELFADRCVSFEDSTKFECIVYGKPTPKIRWFFNDQPVQGRDFLVSTSGERQVLTIPKVSSQTTGKISCVAENDVGKATCVAFLTLNTTGIPPSVEEQYTTQEDTSGSSFVTMQKHITTSTTTKQSSIYGNGTPSQSQFHSTSEQVDSSYKKIGDASPEISESKKFEEFRESSNEPQQTFAQKLLNFTKNDTTDKHESIIANSGQISTGKPVRRNIAPRFVTPLIGKIVDQGVDVILEGIVDGYPSPTIEITKNDEKLEDISGKVEIYYNLNKVNIKLYDVSTKDAGRYSAIAKNDAGSATSTADLVVKKSIFPPVFGRRLQAQAVKKGERVIMDVEITGTPEPQISWFKDDQPLAQVMSSEYRLSQLGNCHKLIIENATLQDSGKYMVKAINSGGEAQSIADFMVLESQPDRMVEITKTVVFSDLPTEPLKSDQIGLQSIPEQNGLTKENYTAHQESTSQAQLGSSTESKVVMETTRTTSATMRLEHKPNFPDLPVTFSQRTQTPTIPLISEGTTMDARAPETKKSVNLTEATQNEQFIKKESLPTHEPLKMPEFTVPVMPEVEPIKQSALDFFENNLKNLPPLAEEKYTRYEDVVKNNKQYMFKRSDIKAEFKSKLDDDLSYLNLKPEPPPEMGFMRKIQPSQPEKISEKVKKLEEIHQTSDTPLSGTIYPQQFKKEERYEKKEFHSSSTVSTSPFVVPQTQSPHPPAAYIPHINRDQLFSDMNAMRSPSPKPSTEAVNMEKLWTMKIKSPEPFLHQQQNFTHEQKSSFVAYSSSQTHQTQKHDFVPPKEVFVPIQPYPTEAVEEQPKPSIKDTKSFFEQRIKEEEQKSVATGPSELKAPGLVRQFAKPMVPLIPLDIEPGAPPEICYAPKPVLERKQSYVEKIEKSLEQNIAREPEKVPHGAVRILPQQQTPQRSITSQSPQRFQTAPSPKPIFHQPVPIQSEVMKPEPIVPAPQVPSRPIYQEPAPIVHQLAQEVPYSKQRQTMSSSEYRSENIEIKKEISNVDNLPGYRSVQPPKFSAQAKSSEPTPVAPVQFEIPIQSSKQQEPVKLPEPFKATTFVPKVEPPKDIPKPQQQFAPQPPTVMRQVPIVQSPAPQQPSFMRQVPIVQSPAPQQFAPQPPSVMRQVPIVQSPVPQQFVQHQMKPTVKPKPKFGEFVSESHETHSLYKNFVRSEESTHSTESYFQKIESPKLIQQPQQPQQQFKKQEPPKQYIQPPNTQQVRKKPYPDVML